MFAGEEAHLLGCDLAFQLYELIWASSLEFKGAKMRKLSTLLATGVLCMNFACTGLF